MRKQKRVEVEWVDSNVLHGWQYGEYKTDLAICKTVGYITEETEEKLVLAQTISGYGAHLGITIIPIGCIKSLKEVRTK